MGRCVEIVQPVFYTYDVGVELTMGRITYSEVAVFEKRPKTGRPGRVLGMTGTEYLWLLGHGQLLMFV